MHMNNRSQLHATLHVLPMLIHLFNTSHQYLIDMFDIYQQVGLCILPAGVECRVLWNQLNAG